MKRGCQQNDRTLADGAGAAAASDCMRAVLVEHMVAEGGPDDDPEELVKPRGPQPRPPTTLSSPLHSSPLLSTRSLDLS